MADSTLLHNATPEELVEKLSVSVKEQLDAFRKELENKETADELLNQKEVCDLLKIDPSTLWNWVKKGKINKYGIGKRRYYKRSEVIQSLILYKV